MANNTQFVNLLSPLKIPHPGGVLEIRNRVLVSAHVPGFAEDNKPGKRYVDYHRRYAKEGVGLQITGGTPVHESGLLSLRSDGLWNLDNSIIPGYKQLANAVHGEGGRILAQLAHSGGTVQIDKPGVTCWSASSIRSSITGHVSHSMTLEEINEVIEAYAAAAARVRLAGLDGVEVLSAFGFLPQAFLSPLSNRRDDEYGGTLQNRMKFLIEVLSAVRVELGSNQILGVRLPGDEFEPGGLQLDDMKMVCQELCNRGLIDYLNIIAHTNFTPTGRSKHWAPTPTPHGVFVDLASAIKAVVTVPVFAVGRIIDPLHAERIIEKGQADMVGMTRAHICDPAIVTKIINQQQAQIRPCVGANTCIANRYNGKAIRCMHNPELKSPGKILQPAMPVRDIAVIGAGPAGLEAARICAMRGHSVSVYEASSKVGGQLGYWAASTSMQELGRIISWRVSELDRLGVSITLEREITPPDLMQLSAKVVIIATGAKDSARNFPEGHTTTIVTPITLLDLKQTTAKKALVISDGRGQAGLVCAEWLLERGVQVEIITEDVAVANDLDPTNRNAWYERLGLAGATFTPQSVVDTINSDCILVRNLFSQSVDKRRSIDLMVDWNGCHSVNTFDSLTDNCQDSFEVHKIGDCVSPRNVEIAMAEALSVAELL